MYHKSDKIIVHFKELEMLVSQALDEFLLSLDAEGASKQTIAWYRSLIRAFCGDYPALMLSSVTANLLRAYLAALRNRAPKQGSRNQQMSIDTLYAHHRALNTFFEWAGREWGIDNPMRNIKRPRRPKANPRHVHQGDVVAMFDVADNLRDKVIIAMLTDTGCRVNDLCQLKWADVDLERGQARVMGKGGKPRLLFISPFTRDLLREWYSQRGRDVSHVIYGRLEDSMQRFGVARALKRLAIKAGISGRYNPHAFRHGFAYAYLMSGGDAGNLSRILGHASVAFTLEQYGLFDVSEIQRKHSELSPIHALSHGEKTKKPTE